MLQLNGSSIEIYADGADIALIEKYVADERIDGFTTNPSLCRKAGVTDYTSFAKEVLSKVNGKPVSFEVFDDDFVEMERQARLISSWGENCFVKIPITNSAGEFTGPVIESLTKDGVLVNVTAVFTTDQIAAAAERIKRQGSIISIFAGRIADCGYDPSTMFWYARKFLMDKGIKYLWASAREAFNVVQAKRVGAQIITLQPELIEKLSGYNRSLTEYSLETVRQFKRDAEGFTL